MDQQLESIETLLSDLEELDDAQAQDPDKQIAQLEQIQGALERELKTIKLD